MTRRITLVETSSGFVTEKDVRPSIAPAPFMTPRFAGFTLPVGSTVRYSERGIPSVKIWSTGQWNESPTTIAQWGLGHYARGEYELALRAGDWLVSIQRADGGFPLTFNHSVAGGYNLTAPWLSAIAQGNALSLLSRLFLLTRFEPYRQAAIKGLLPLSKTVAQGGVQGTLNSGMWFEETPDPNYPNHIFNGSVFALLGINDVANLLNEPAALALWTPGELGLRNNLNTHVVWSPLHPGATRTFPDPWAVYDLQVNGVPTVPNYLQGFYMQLHCELLEEMASRLSGTPAISAAYTAVSQPLRISLNAYRAAGGPE